MRCLDGIDDRDPHLQIQGNLLLDRNLNISAYALIYPGIFDT
jgi:hypothetical protein